MKQLLGLILVFSFVQAANAAAERFKCTAYHLDKTSGEISKLVIDQDAGSLNDQALDLKEMGNMSIYDGPISYSGAKGLSVETTIKKKASLVDLDGAIGAREHQVILNSVIMTVKINGRSEIFSGTCTNLFISTCGGATPCDGWQKWQVEP